MKGNRYKSMHRANILFENRFLWSKTLLKESSGELESKRNEIVNKLTQLKDVQKGIFASIKKSKIDEYINDLKNADLDNSCDGTKLKSELQSKLNSAKQGLEQYKDQIDDPNNLLPSLKNDISFIENFCSTQTQQNNSTSQPTTQQNNSTSQSTTQTQQRMRDENPPSNQSTTQTQQNTTPSNLEQFKNMRFMDALDTLNTGENFTKNDIINYVKSKVTVKST